MSSAIQKLQDLTIKQRKFLKAYVETGNATEAAMMAYDTTDRVTAGAIGYENLKKLQTDELMEEMGLTDKALFGMVAVGISKPTKFESNGKETLERPDYAVRHRYLETALKLKGKLGNTNPTNQFNAEEMTFVWGGKTAQTEDTSQPVDKPEENKLT